MPVSVTEEHSMVSRIFRCGLSHSESHAKFHALNEEQRDVLNRVAWRVWFTLELRHGCVINMLPEC